MRPGFIALIAALSGPASGQSLTHISTTDWPLSAVVGLSGLEVSDDGASFTTISDRGWWLEGRFVRQGDAIAEIALDRLVPILGTDGLPVAARRLGDWSDSEGLAIAPDGTAWVSFERYAHVWRYDVPGGPATGIRDHPTFYEYDENRQLEALAVAPDGTLYTFPEQPLDAGFPIYRLDEATWVIDGYLPRRDGFAIVGADFDSNGDLYLLERKLSLLLWWQSRIRRVRLDGSEDRTIWTSQRGDFYNLEGIALWRDEQGLRITMVSDSNSSAREITQFVEFRLTE